MNVTRSLNGAFVRKKICLPAFITDLREHVMPKAEERVKKNLIFSLFLNRRVKASKAAGERLKSKYVSLCHHFVPSSRLRALGSYWQVLLDRYDPRPTKAVIPKEIWEIRGEVNWRDPKFLDVARVIVWLLRFGGMFPVVHQSRRFHYFESKEGIGAYKEKNVRLYACTCMWIINF